jgi:predicted signal transduction protein with EAL and GGDEF domain
VSQSFWSVVQIEDQIEITESVLLQGAGQVADTVRNLKHLGVRLSIETSAPATRR